MIVKKNKKVIVAMSGGVDSSVSASILQNKKYQVEGIFMKNWEEDDQEEYCHSAKDLSDAQKVCEKLNIYLHKINFSEEYWEKVFKDFLQQHKKGKTPNPDILCNKEIKFKYLLNYSLHELQADYLATGHYARIKITNKQYHLLKGIDVNKDQSYFLYTLKHTQLKKILFPLGELTKKEVRKIAKKIRLEVAEKKDSTGICFIGPKKIKNFLNLYLNQKKGNIITTDGRIVGQHEGLFHYTLGQRKGLKIGGIKGKYSLPWYVVDKEIKNNALVVAQGSDNKYLMSKGLIAKKINWINSNNEIIFPFYCTMKTRYHQKDIGCYVEYISKMCIKIIFNNPVSAVTPGQSVVLYLSEVCIGGGIIDSRLPLL